MIRLQAAVNCPRCKAQTWHNVHPEHVDDKNCLALTCCGCMTTILANKKMFDKIDLAISKFHKSVKRHGDS